MFDDVSTIPELLAAAASAGRTGAARSALMKVPWLSILVFLPAVGALAIALLTRSGRPEHARRIALGTTLAAWLPAAIVLIAFDPNPHNPPRPTIADALRIPVAETTSFNVTGLESPLTERRTWLGGVIGSTYYLGIDGISLWLVVLTVMLGPVVVLASASIRDRVREYFIFLLILQTAMTGVFLAQDLLLFYIFFEFTLIPMYFIIGIWGGPERRYAANKFFLYTFVGSVLTFAGILWLALFYSQTTDRVAAMMQAQAVRADPSAGIRFDGRPMTFDMQEMMALLRPMVEAAGRTDYWNAAQVWLFLALFVGFAVKVPIFPLHTWLPLAHVEAPTAGSVVLAAVLLKMGTYGLLKIAIPLAPHGAMAAVPWVVALGIVGIIYGALVALAQSDIKRLIAYSSVSHLGWCIVGMFSFTPQGVAGSVMQMVNHGISTGALFLLVGTVYDRYHTREIDRYGGLWGRMPAFAFFLILFTLSSVGLPGTNGFVGEFLVLIGMFQARGAQDGTAALDFCGATYAVFTATGIVLGAWYMFYLCRRLLFGPELLPEPPDEHGPEHDRSPADLNRRERLMLGLLVPVVFLIGIFPRFFLSRMESSVNALLTTVERSRVTVGRPRSAETRPSPAPTGHEH
jgi:NADH-quinone oxidoreductase subunit M